MLKKHLILIFVICQSLNLSATQDDVFKTSLVGSNSLTTEVKINLEHGNQAIGFIYYIQLPFKIYVIHSFFVFSQFRNLGYGKELLKYAMNTLKAAGAKLIFIQPGPFELKNQQSENLPIGVERTLSIKRLVKIYHLNGFKFAPRIISLGALLVYKAARIQEDPQYLMLKRY